MARKIIFTSGKGGVGKTTVAANLGASLAKTGKRTCVLDCDFGLNNLDVVAGVENLVVYDVSDCIAGRCRAKQALIESPFVKNLYILPSADSFTKQNPPSDLLQELIDGLGASFDFLLIDCPAGLGGGFHLAASCADEAIVVTTPHIPSLRDADKTLSALGSYSLKSVGILLNRVRGDLLAAGVTLTPSQIAKTLSAPLIGIIPDDDCVFTETAGELPRDSSAYKAFSVLAKNVSGSGKIRLYDPSFKYSGFFGGIRREIRRRV